MRIIGLDIHRAFAEAVAWDDGKLKRLGRVDMRRPLLEAFAKKLSKEDVPKTSLLHPVTSRCWLSVANTWSLRVSFLICGLASARKWPTKPECNGPSPTRFAFSHS